MRVPVPRSCEPSLASTEPSELMVTSHSEAVPRPPQVCIDMPSPRLIGPGVLSPRKWAFCL